LRQYPPDRSAVLFVRMDPALMELLKRAAKASDQHVTQFARSRLREAANKAIRSDDRKARVNGP